MHGQRFLSFAIVALFASQGRSLFEHIDLLLHIRANRRFFYHYFFVERLIAGNFIGDQEFKFHIDGSPLALAVALAAFLHGPLIAIELTSVRLLSFFIRHQMA